MTSPMLIDRAVYPTAIDRAAPTRKSAVVFLAAQDRSALVQVVWNAAYDAGSVPGEAFTIDQCEAVVRALLDGPA